jgi:hypothetical protein
MDGAPWSMFQFQVAVCAIPTPKDPEDGRSCQVSIKQWGKERLHPTPETPEPADTGRGTVA